MANSTPSTCKLIFNEKVYGSVIYGSGQPIMNKIHYRVTTYSTGGYDASLNVIKTVDDVSTTENVPYRSVSDTKKYYEGFYIKYNTIITSWELGLYPYSSSDIVTWQYTEQHDDSFDVYINVEKST